MERAFGRVIDLLPGLVWTALADGRADFVNRRWCEYTGLGFAEARGHGWHAAVHPDDRPRLVEHWLSSVGSGEPGETEARLRRSDGAYRAFLFRFCPIADASGDIVSWCGINTDIDDRKQAEEALRAHERRARMIVDGLPAMVTLMTPEGELENANRYMLDYFGETLEVLKSRPVGYSFHPEDRPEVLARWRHSVQTGEPYDHQARLRRADGLYRWFHTVGFPLRDEEGRILLWYLLQADIDDRKRSEQRLRRSESFLAEGQRLSLTGSFSWRPDTDEITFSEELCRIFEFEPETPVTIERVGGRIHPEDMPLLTEKIESAQDGGDQDYNIRLRMPDGSVKYLHTKSRGIRGAEGMLEYIGAIQDITERKRYEEELRRSNAYLAEAQRLSLTGSFSWRPASDAITWSDQVYRMFGVDAGLPVTLELIAARVHPEDLSILEDMVDRARSEASDLEYEHRLVMPDGAVKHLRLIAHGNRDQNGEMEYIGAVQDITDRRSSEAALAKVRAELAHIARVTSLSALTASIAHEVNQPLSGIITNANTCLKMLAADPPNVLGAQETARRTVRDGVRAADVIRRLRALFTKKEATFEPVDLNEAAREVVALSWSDLQRSRVIVRSELADDLPPVMGDRVQLRQVILNLLLNAADAVRGVEDRPRQVLITTAQEEGRVRFSIRDSGVGFGRKAVEKLFEAFYTSKADGMGIGLSVSRSIVETHGGQLSAALNDGPGATFSFSVPARPWNASDVAGVDVLPVAPPALPPHAEAR